MTPRASVLVVEDNPLTRKMLRMTLESEGYAVREAGDGRSALRAAQERLPALVLLDLILPDMNGVDLMRELRGLEGAAELPILALSGFLGRIEDHQVAGAGFSALLLKPIEPPELLARVRTYVPAPAAKVTGARHRLLLVDDDAAQLTLTRIAFADLGFEVTTALGAVDALRSVRHARPEVVLAEAVMPLIDGYQLCLDLRADPALADLPVVLISSEYTTPQDHELARHVGASALIVRTPDLEDASAAVRDALRSGAPPVTVVPSDALKLEHALAVIEQLHRQLAMSAGLSRRCTLQAAQISLLSGVADALTRKGSAELALRDVLAATLAAAGISRGALFLRDAHGALVLKHGIGFTDVQLGDLRELFGRGTFLEVMMSRQRVVSVPSPGVPSSVYMAILEVADVASVHIVPLIVKDATAGAMLLAAHSGEGSGDESIAFARAMGNQLVQYLELARSFEQLAASEERYRTLMESSNDGIALIAPDGTIREANKRMAADLGLAPADVVGRHIADFAAPGHSVENLEKFADAVTRDARRPQRSEVRRADGTSIIVEYSTVNVEIAGEKLALAVGRDVTDAVKAQAQLMISDRMASLGSLAAGVAHEIKNPLAAVMFNLEFAKQSLDEVARTHPELQLKELLEAQADALESAGRVAQIVTDLRIFSREKADVREPTDVVKVLDTTVRMAWNEIRHRARLVRAAAEVPLVDASDARLGQVFLNLIVNAAQAIPEGNAEDNEIRIETRLDGGRVCVEISDTGPGIPPEVMARLFAPFVTTKPEGVGTGLGLSICKRIITALGGEIRVSRSDRTGTTFRIDLPVAAAIEASVAPAAVAPPARRRGRILIVDDEPAVGGALRRVLARHHDAQVVTEASLALALIGAGERFDVILSDVMMPSMPGAQFHHELHLLNPDQAARTIFMTGGAFTPESKAFLDSQPNPWLEKPLDSKRLLALIGERLT